MLREDGEKAILVTDVVPPEHHPAFIAMELDWEFAMFDVTKTHEIAKMDDFAGLLRFGNYVVVFPDLVKEPRLFILQFVVFAIDGLSGFVNGAPIIDRCVDKSKPFTGDLTGPGDVVLVRIALSCPRRR